MKIISLDQIKKTEREVSCPHEGFTSYRFLLKKDNMGFGLHKTFIPKGEPQHWHYKNHLEACYCLSGLGIIENVSTGETFEIKKDVLYVLDKNDEHMFQSIEDVELICVFNPPLTGNEVHNKDGVYEI